jgi:branched-chain amino acid transport system substrate-binding protein
MSRHKCALRLTAQAAALATALLAAGTGLAQKKYDPGATDSQILIGQTNPYSGPLSSYSTQGRVQAAFYTMINEQGGVDGRKIKLISLDDGYQPPRTVEQTRKLVEDDQVVAIVGSMGTPTNTAIVKYMNAKKVPHILLATGASKWGHPRENPWTMG